MVDVFHRRAAREVAAKTGATIGGYGGLALGSGLGLLASFKMAGLEVASHGALGALSNASPYFAIPLAAASFLMALWMAKGPTTNPIVKNIGRLGLLSLIVTPGIFISYCFGFHPSVLSMPFILSSYAIGGFNAGGVAGRFAGPSVFGPRNDGPR